MRRFFATPPRPAFALGLAACLFLGCGASAEDLRPLIGPLMRDEQELANVRFADVVSAATGKKIIPLGTNGADRAFIAKVGSALDRVLAAMNATNSPAHAKRRINEVSSLFEESIRAELNKVDGLVCDFPRTSGGAYQRSGYPDLRVIDKPTGRIAYIDPKLFERGSKGSSFRTFYFEPKRNTNKILDDAHHLVVGVEHDGKSNGRWQFTRWELIDLANFRVKLKAEFQASNREMYRPEAIVAAGTNFSLSRPAK